MDNDTQQMAVDLIAIIHRSMNWDIWGRKRLTYWSTMQNAIKSAALTTNNLGTFLNSLCSKMSVEAVGVNKNERAMLDTILSSGEDRALLQLLREQTALIVVKVSVANEDRKAQKQREMEEDHDISSTVA